MALGRWTTSLLVHQVRMVYLVKDRCE